MAFILGFKYSLPMAWYFGFVVVWAILTYIFTNIICNHFGWEVGEIVGGEFDWTFAGFAVFALLWVIGALILWLSVHFSKKSGTDGGSCGGGGCG